MPYNFEKEECDVPEYKTALGESGTEYDCAYVKFKENLGADRDKVG